jgi:predicted RNA binding protein YcfA (HicA-like mRNA interferase family)
MNKLNKIVLKYGLEKMELWTDGELTIGKLLSFSKIQAQLGYDYHNVLTLRNGVALDFETSIGSEDITLVLETAVNVKGAVNRRKLIRGLSRLVKLEFKRHGGRHDIFVTGDGVQIQIPRHPGDVANGTLRSIVRDAFPNMSLSEFKSKIS